VKVYIINDYSGKEIVLEMTEEDIIQSSNFWKRLGWTIVKSE
jgi:hypothetical protein